MIRRTVRWFIAEVCLLSLLACLGVGWLWWRSHHGDRPRLSLRLPVTRYTVRTGPGRLTLWGPPPPATAAGTAKAARAAAMLRNRDIRMTVWARIEVREFELRHFTGAAAEPGTPAEVLWEADADAIAPLLEALDDPARFAAAHVLLTHRLVPNPQPSGPFFRFIDANENLYYVPMEPGPAGTLRIIYNAMRVELSPAPSEVERLFAEDRANPHELVAGDVRMEIRADPVQLPALREHWHDKLDVPIGSAPHWALVVGLAIPPAFWCGTSGRRMRRRWWRARLGLCLACGYDLRHSPGKCPECGADRARAASATL